MSTVGIADKISRANREIEQKEKTIEDLRNGLGKINDTIDEAIVDKILIIQADIDYLKFYKDFIGRA